MYLGPDFPLVMAERWRVNLPPCPPRLTLAPSCACLPQSGIPATCPLSSSLRPGSRMMWRLHWGRTRLQPSKPCWRPAHCPAQTGEKAWGYAKGKFKQKGQVHFCQGGGAPHSGYRLCHCNMMCGTLRHRNAATYGVLLAQGQPSARVLRQACPVLQPDSLPGAECLGAGSAGRRDPLW